MGRRVKGMLIFLSTKTYEVSVFKFAHLFCVLALFVQLLAGSQAHAEDDGLLDPFQATSDAPHDLQMLNSGLAAMEKRLQLVEKARHSIDIEMFIYNADNAGRMFTQALVKKAKAGVKVRLLLDHFMIGSTITPFHAHELEEQGIIVRYYNKAPVITSRVHYRNHRKSMIIDGTEAIIGGRNIADEYFDLSEDYNFVDRDLWLKGPIVSAIAESFQDVWDSRYVVKLKRERRPSPGDIRYTQDYENGARNFRRDLKEWNQQAQMAKVFIFETQDDQRLLDKVRTQGKVELSKEFVDRCNKNSFYSDKPGHGRSHRRNGRLLRKEIFERMNAVKERMTIDTPYFIADKNTRPIIDDLLDRGVSIDLLTNGLYSTDASYVAAVFYHYYKRWLRAGLKPHIYQGDALSYYPAINEEVRSARWGTHSKSFVFDNDSSMIGSYNFDPRSNVYSLELAYFCDENPRLAHALRTDIELRMEQSYYLDSVESFRENRFERVKLFKRIGFYLLKFPSLLLQGLL